MNQDTLIYIHRLLVYLRADLMNESCLTILEIISETLSKNYSDQQMKELLDQRIAKDMIPVQRKETPPSNNATYILTSFEESLFTHVMQYSILMIQEYLTHHKYETAYDVIDAMHVFPEIIPGCDRKRLRNYWKVYIKPLRKKLDGSSYNEMKRYFG